MTRSPLWADTFEEKPLTMDLLFHPGQRKEGCLSLVLHWGSLDFYQMMFWFGLSPETGKPALLWGPFRERPLGNEAVKAMTKNFWLPHQEPDLLWSSHGSRPHGAETIYAVTNAGYYAMNHVRMDRKLKTNFGDFWAECGGTPHTGPALL